MLSTVWGGGVLPSARAALEKAPLGWSSTALEPRWLEKAMQRQALG